MARALDSTACHPFNPFNSFNIVNAITFAIVLALASSIARITFIELSVLLPDQLRSNHVYSRGKPTR
jgi:hypothetical protein